MSALQQAFAPPRNQIKICFYAETLFRLSSITML